MKEIEAFWYVWVEGDSAPSYKHRTVGSAKEEAERLARINGGKLVSVFELVGTCRKRDVD